MTITSASHSSSPDSGPPGFKPRTAVRKAADRKEVPSRRSVREQIRRACGDEARRLDPSQPLSMDTMERVASRLLRDAALPPSYLGWTMVALASEFWREQVAATSPARRLLLLPHCLKRAVGCPAEYEQHGLECHECGACSIADFRGVAERLGYRVLIAEGSPIVLKIIVSGQVDAIVGVACLNVLEKAIDKILAAGIPCMAVPLLSHDCRISSVDEDWVLEMIRLQGPPTRQAPRSYLHLMRGAAGLFASPEFERLLPRRRADATTPPGTAAPALDPIAATEAIAYEFLAAGGKYSRPFITLAAYDALTGGQATARDGSDCVQAFPDAVKRTALSIEIFHKASLVHDDIEDDDAFRYGQTTLHRRWGAPTAINVGDYLIGRGYRLVSSETPALGPQVVADLLDCLADAHTRLCEGQGAELLWRDARDKRLTPLDALKIYALKTAPAFEAALVCGLRLAGTVEPYRQPVRRFASNLGIAFQILNDLDDWQEDRLNKRQPGRDLLDGRPTLLWALALQNLPRQTLEELTRLVGDPRKTDDDPARLHRAGQLYREAGVFDQAHQLIEKHRARAEQIARQIQPERLQHLLTYLIQAVLRWPQTR